MINEMTTQKISTRDMAIIPIFSVLTAVGAFIKIPVGPVPVSLQTVFVVLSALILGRKAVYAQLIYVLLGLLGLPVFTGGGGIGYIFTPTFGYLLGFILAAFIMGSLRDALKDTSFLRLLPMALLGLVIIYASGVTYLFTLKNFILPDSSMSLQNALKFGALIFLPMDTLWCTFGALLGSRILRNPAYRRMRAL